MTPASTIAFVLAAEAIGIDLFGWDADWAGARIALAQTRLQWGRPG